MELHVVSIFGWPHDIPCPKNFSGGRLWANRALGFTCQGAVDPWCQRCRWLQIHIHIHTYTHICIYHYTPLKVRFSHRFSTDCGTDHATFSSALALWQLIAVIATGFIEIWGDIRPISQHSTDFNSKLHQVPVKVTGYLGAAACEHGEVMRRRGYPSSNGLNLSWWFRKLRIQGGANEQKHQPISLQVSLLWGVWMGPAMVPAISSCRFAWPGYFSFQPGSCSCHSQREGTGASMGLPNPFRCCQLKQGVWPTWYGKPQLTHPELWNPKLKVFCVYQISVELGPSWDCLCGAVDAWKHPPYPPGI